MLGGPFDAQWWWGSGKARGDEDISERTDNDSLEDVEMARQEKEPATAAASTAAATARKTVAAEAAAAEQGIVHELPVTAPFAEEDAGEQRWERGMRRLVDGGSPLVRTGGSGNVATQLSGVGSMGPKGGGGRGRRGLLNVRIMG